MAVMTLRLYTKAEVADILGCSVRNIEYMMADGRITYIKIGNLVRFRQSDIDRVFEGTATPLDRKMLKSERTTAVDSAGTCGSRRGVS